MISSLWAKANFYYQTHIQNLSMSIKEKFNKKPNKPNIIVVMTRRQFPSHNTLSLDLSFKTVYLR